MVVLADVDEREVENKTKRLKTKKRTHQCAPSANPLIATAANTPPGVGDAHTTAIPTATSDCAAISVAARGAPARAPASEHSPSTSRPTQLHTLKSDTSAAEDAASDAPQAAATTS